MDGGAEPKTSLVPMVIVEPSSDAENASDNEGKQQEEMLWRQAEDHSSERLGQQIQAEAARKLSVPWFLGHIGKLECSCDTLPGSRVYNPESGDSIVPEPVSQLAIAKDDSRVQLPLHSCRSWPTTINCGMSHILLSDDSDNCGELSYTNDQSISDFDSALDCHHHQCGDAPDRYTSSLWKVTRQQRGNLPRLFTVSLHGQGAGGRSPTTSMVNCRRKIGLPSGSQPIIRSGDSLSDCLLTCADGSNSLRSAVSFQNTVGLITAAAGRSSNALLQEPPGLPLPPGGGARCHSLGGLTSGLHPTVSPSDAAQLPTPKYSLETLSSSTSGLVVNTCSCCSVSCCYPQPAQPACDLVGNSRPRDDRLATEPHRLLLQQHQCDYKSGAAKAISLDSCSNLPCYASHSQLSTPMTSVCSLPPAGSLLINNNSIGNANTPAGGLIIRANRWLRRRLSNQLSLSSADIHPNEANGSLLNFARNLPEWTVTSELGGHLWNDTNATDDLCYQNDVDSCQTETEKCPNRPVASLHGCLRKSGTRKKCSVCRITCHTCCLPKIQFACRPTYREADIHQLQAEAVSTGHTTHHWVHRRRPESKCRHCSKSIRPKFPFANKEFVAVQCTWCKASYHNKTPCYPYDKLTEACGLGAHKALIVPPYWIVKLTDRNPSIRRTSSLTLSASLPTRITGSPLSCSTSGPIDGSSQTNVASDATPVQTSGTSDKLAPLSVPFLIKPNPDEAETLRPLLVFLNPKSGGNQGVSLLRKFQWLLNPRQVFDLSQKGPQFGLELFRRVPNLRVLVCGGDGTVGWLLSTIDELRLAAWPPVAVLPLGTGNDLARTLHWGSGYVDEPISNVLHSVQHAEVIALDRWRVDCQVQDNLCVPVNEHNEESASDPECRRLDVRQNGALSTLPLKVFNNYFSIGADAATALDFHESREANPEKFNSRLKNKMFYAGRGGKDVIVRNWRDLADHVTLKCDGKDLTPLIRTIRPHVILFLNIPKYGAGTQPWGHTPDDAGFRPQQINDGLIEVMVLSAMSLALLQVGGHGDRICQCRRITLTTDRVIPMQMDGEACRLLPSVIKVRAAKQALVLQRKHAKVPKLMIRISNSAFFAQYGNQTNLTVSVISLKDYEAISEDAVALRQAAVYYSTVPVQFDARLATVRESIAALSGRDLECLPAGSSLKEMDSSLETRQVQVETRVQFKLSENWEFIDSTKAASLFFRIDCRQLESTYCITDICNLEELFLLDPDMPSRLSAADDWVHSQPIGEKQCLTAVATAANDRYSVEPANLEEALAAGSLRLSPVHRSEDHRGLFWLP